MPSSRDIEDVADQFLQSVLATPKRQRRLLSRTFWDRFGFKVRTRERTAQVAAVLRERALVIGSGDAPFGSEDRDSWLMITHVPADVAHGPVAAAEPESPPAAWFDRVENATFESEREVEYYFLVPLFEQLGYHHDDFVIGCRVQMYEGVNRVNKEADLVLFDGAGRSKDAALVVVEAKRTGRVLVDDAVGQARAYALWLSTPYYVVTNGDELRVYLFRGAVQPDVLLLTLHRSALRQRWTELRDILQRARVIERKAHLARLLAVTGA